MTSASDATQHDDAQPMRVLHIVESWPPVMSGYTTRSARIVAAQAARPDLEPVVAVTSRQHVDRGAIARTPSAAEIDGVGGIAVQIASESPLERTVRRIRPYFIDSTAFERWLDKELLRLRPDVVHVHWSSSIGAIAVDAGHRHGVPVIAEVRFDLAGVVVDEAAGGRLGRLEAPLRRHFERHLARADAVIASSHALGDLVAEHTGVRAEIFENAVDTPPVADPAAVAALRESFGATTDTVLIGGVGLTRDHDGFDQLIDIAAEQQRTGADVRPVLVGEGPESTRLARRASLAGVDLIAPGAVDAADLPTWYAAIDIVVVPRLDVPATRSGTPTKVLEAMAHGRPIVASAVGDVELLLADGSGISVAPGDPILLRSTVDSLIDDPRRREELALRARESATSRHSWAAGAEQLRAIYEATARARHTPGRESVGGDVSKRQRDDRLRPRTPLRAERLDAVRRSDGERDESARNLVVIGAGPAGLTAALDAARRSDLRPIVLEASDAIGGLSRTVEHNGNLIDIGGHRFFSKSERVTDWWLDVLPLADGAVWRPDDAEDGPDPHTDDQVMLVRRRRSQILWNSTLFDYPLDLSVGLVRKLGIRRTVKAGLSYVKSQAFPVAPVDNLEDFYINRFGRELYSTFFESYTEKVWGMPCREISPDWGAQRVKGLSLWSALWHAIKPARRGDAAQRDVATSLVERFLYPKFGPGQMWETAASKVLDHDGDVITEVAVTGFEFEEAADSVAADGAPKITAVRAIDRASGDEIVIEAEHVVSTMPLNRLVDALGDQVSANAHEIADGLSFRDFITVGVLVDNLRLTEPDGGALLDNWLYIQEPDVLVGRLQIFNNWSPWMVADPLKSWIGLEYFCNDTDPMWEWSEDRLVRLAGQELAAIGVIEPGGVLEGCAIKVRRAYPSYVGTYDRLGELQPELTGIANLWCAGRNGQHRYNNQDHSMLASMMSIDQIAAGTRDADVIWDVNIDDDYHEGD